MDLVTYFQHVVTPWIRARFERRERGAALVEYALLLALVAIFCVVALTFIGEKSASKFSQLGNGIG